jgi:hypothetical protein
VTEMVDGWIDVPVVHGPIVRTRFEKENLLRLRGTESESQVAVAKYIWYSTRFLSFPSIGFQVLPDAP